MAETSKVIRDTADRGLVSQVHGSLLPKSLHRLTVQAACGSEWRQGKRSFTLITLDNRDHSWQLTTPYAGLKMGSLLWNAP